MDFHFASVKEVALVGPAVGRRARRAGGRGALGLSPLRSSSPAGREGTERPELMRERSAVDGSPAAYVCENFSCRRPVTEPEELASALG